MSGVNVGAFQNIVGVQWNDPLPAILIVRMIVREQFSPPLTGLAYFVTAILPTELPTSFELGMSETRYGDNVRWNRLYGRTFSAVHASNVISRPPASCALWIDLRQIRAAYADYNADIAGDTGATAIPCPDFFDIEIGGFVDSSNFFDSGTAPCEVHAELVGGDGAAVFEADKGPSFSDLGTINGRGRVIDGRFSTLFAVGIEQGDRQFARGQTIASIRVSTIEIALSFNEELTA